MDVILGATTEVVCTKCGHSNTFVPSFPVAQLSKAVEDYQSKAALTDDKLMAILRNAMAKGPMSDDQIREQRISWVAGQLRLSNPKRSAKVCRRLAEEVVDGSSKS